MSRRELVRIGPPAGTGASWHYCGKKTRPDGAVIRLEGWGVCFAQGIEFLSLGKEWVDSRGRPRQFVGTEEASWGDVREEMLYLLENGLPGMGPLRGGFGWIADADGRLECYQLRKLDTDEPREALPDLVGKVLPFGPRPRGVEKVA